MLLIGVKSLVFIDSMQFMNSSLENLVKNLSDNDFKYFSSENLELLKQKDAYPFEYIDSFKEKKCLIKNVFIAPQKMEQLGIMVKN